MCKINFSSFNLRISTPEFSNEADMQAEVYGRISILGFSPANDSILLGLIIVSVAIKLTVAAGSAVSSWV